MSLLNHLIGLVNGDVKPSNGLEIHFISVCKGEARAVSPEEKMWVEVYTTGNSSAIPVNSPSPTTTPSKSKLDSDSVLVSSLKAELRSSRDAESNLRSSLTNLEILNRSLSDSIAQLKGDLFKKNDEIFQLTRRVSSLKEEVSKIDAEKNQISSNLISITSDIDKSIKDGVKKGNMELYERELKLSKQIELYKLNIQSLMEYLVSLIPAKIKCVECDGNPHWTDRNKIQTGLDYEGPNQSFSCSSCNGAGWLLNPKREGKEVLFSRKHMFLDED